MSSEYPPNIVGGNGILCRNISKGLSNVGMDITVLTKDKIEGIYIEENVKIIKVNCNGSIYLSDKKSLYAQRINFIKSSLKYITETYDFILLIDLFLFPEASIISKKIRCPIINMFTQSFSEIFEIEQADEYKVSDIYSVSKDEALYLETECFKKSHANIFISDSAKKQMEKKYGVRENHYVATLGIDCKEFDPVDNPCDKSDVPRIIGIGRLSKVKNFETFIEAAQIVLKQNENVEFHLYGKGAEYENLYRKIVDYGIEDKFKIEYLPDREQLVTELKKGSIAVAPSYWESFGFTFVELMYLKKAVICSNIEVYKEIIGNNNNVIMMKHNDDSVEMAEYILELIHNKEKADILGNNAHEYVKNNFTTMQFINRLLFAIKEIEADYEKC